MFVELKSKLGQMHAFYRRKRPCGKRPRRRLIEIYPIPGDHSYKITPQERLRYSKDQYNIGRNLRMPGLGVAIDYLCVVVENARTAWKTVSVAECEDGRIVWIGMFHGAVDKYCDWNLEGAVSYSAPERPHTLKSHHRDPAVERNCRK